MPRLFQSFGALGAPTDRLSKSKALDIYVCTHGARDCRCGDIGGDLVRVLRSTAPPDVRVFDIGHVGGHKWAGNILVFPLGDWYGNLRPADIPQFLEHITSPDRHEPMWTHWRGRMGLSQDMQIALHRAATNPESEVTEDAKFSLAPIARTNVDRPIHEIKFISWDGREIIVKAKEGENLMQIAKDAGLESVEGICGGNLECATCHMYIPSSAPLPRMSDAEDDMLAYAIKRQDGESRLGCQIDVTPELAAWVAEGGRINLPRF
ncbi:ferredoxin [Ceratobasidium sp. AG-I]|nr:ferredoxin [Ceratobasidium sp. AG-I]